MSNNAWGLETGLVHAGTDPYPATGARVDLARVPLPDVALASPVVRAPGEGPGYWAGAPSVVFDEGVFYAAYRMRRPKDKGRGYALIVARSDDGVDFEPVLELRKEAFESESLERAALVRDLDGRWRIYMSCATPGTLHWRIDAIDADDPASFDPSERRVVLAGDERTAVKDPVVLRDANGWRMWVCCHPLPDPTEADRMTTRLATSKDGLTWNMGPIVLNTRDGMWDERGARISCVIDVDGSSFAYYDGRRSAAQNAEECVGLAIATDHAAFFEAIGDAPVALSPYGSRSLRYVTALALPDRSWQLYFEATDATGAHQLLTQRVPAT